MAASHRQTTFLFVNKNEKSVSLSNSRYDKTSAINRHVQRWRSQRHRDKKRQTFCDTGQQASSKVTEDVKLNLDTPQLSSFTTPSDVTTNSLESLEIISPSNSSDDASIQELDDIDSEADQTAVILKANFSEGACVDPFNCTAIRLDQNVQSILQYYIAFSVPSRERSQNQTRTRGCFFKLGDELPAVKEVVHGCLFNKMHMYALLTATSARMEEVSLVNLRRKNTARYFMNKALKHVRAYLTARDDQTVDKQVILDIFYLCVCEWYLQNYQAALTHLKAVGHLMKTLDGNAFFDRFITETVSYNDIFLSVETSTPPLFPLDWDGPTMPPERRTTISQDLGALLTYRRMGRGFTDPAQNHIFSFEMNTIVFEIVPWMDVAQYTWICRAKDPEDSEWVCKKGQALLHRLLSCRVPRLDQPDLPLKRRYEECCRILLIIMISYISTQMAWRSGAMNLARLKRALHGVDRDWGSIPLNCMLLWVLLCAAFVAEGTSNERWFLSRAEPVAKDLQITTYDRLHELMCQYFYSSRLQQGILRKLLGALGREDQAMLSYAKAPPMSPEYVYRQRFGYNLAPIPGQNLCRKGHWEATSTLSCLAEFLSEDEDFVAAKHLRSRANSKAEDMQG